MAIKTQTLTLPEIKPVLSRFRNALGKYRVTVTTSCNNCGLCVTICPYGVYKTGSKKPRVVAEHLCLGFPCREKEFFCVNRCPEKAIQLSLNPSFEILGDKRWSADLLASAWHMAETGEIPYQGLNYKTGNSGGGFDKLRFIFPKGKGLDIPDEEVSTAIELNRSGDSRPGVTIQVPFYFGGMSFGSVSIVTMLSRVRAAAALKTFCCTGEGGYPEELIPYDDHIITQVATGLFGVREETIKRVRSVEFKYAQGAKPGLGGHLLGDKVTPRVASMREAVAGSALFSPFPFHSVYSVVVH